MVGVYSLAIPGCSSCSEGTAIECGLELIVVDRTGSLSRAGAMKFCCLSDTSETSLEPRRSVQNKLTRLRKLDSDLVVAPCSIRAEQGSHPRSSSVLSLPSQRKPYANT